jgi:hypothetical protein
MDIADPEALALLLCRLFPRSRLAFGVSASTLKSCAVLAWLQTVVWRRISAQTITIATAVPATRAAASE